MNIWPADTVKPMSVIAGSNAVVKAYFKKRETNDSFVEITESFVYRNESVWEVTAEFTVGEYLLRVDIDNIPEYIELSVVPIEQYDFTINQQVIKDKIDSAQSFKTMS